MGVAKRMWNLAIRWELATANPFTRIELYREKPRERTAKTSELEAIGRAMAELALPDPVRRCIILLATTGCRSGEARRLRWEDTTLDAGGALLRDTKNHEDRVLGLNAVAVAALAPAQRDSGWVCPSISDERKPLSRADPWQLLAKDQGRCRMPRSTDPRSEAWPRHPGRPGRRQRAPGPRSARPQDARHGQQVRRPRGGGGRCSAAQGRHDDRRGPGRRCQCAGGSAAGAPSWMSAIEATQELMDHAHQLTVERQQVARAD